jgi:MFS transporter, AAHS family, 4-hydroxybenzoate transporter
MLPYAANGLGEGWRGSGSDDIGNCVTTPPTLHLRVASLCFLVLFLEGYDITAMSYAIPSLTEAWHAKPPQFTAALTAGSVGLLLGAVSAGLLGDRLGRKPVLIGCTMIFGVFSLSTAWSNGLGWLAVLRFLTGLGLGGGIPIAIALATDYAPQRNPRRLVILMSAGISVGNTIGGFIAAQIVRLSSWEMIFIVGGLLPILVIPFMIVFMPESSALRAAHAAESGARRATPFDLFRHGLALRTSVLWMVNLFNLVGNYFILFWLPSILHAKGLSPSAAILATTMYALGTILGALVTAPIVDRLGVERVIACILCMGALCVLLIGMLDLPFAVLCVVICAAGMGIGGCQHGINSVSGALYPPPIRSTGTGWALALGRVGQIGGPLIGGMLLGLGWTSRDIFLAASGPAFCVAIGMATLGWLRQAHDGRAATTAAIVP